MKILGIGELKCNQLVVETFIQNFPYEYRKELQNTYIVNRNNKFLIYVDKKGELFRGTAFAGNNSFDTREECLTYCKNQVRKDVDALREASKEERKGTGRQDLNPPQLKHIERTGPDYRQGKDIEPDALLSTFDFRGGEFGNWTNQNERQQYLNWAYDSLIDLAKVLNFPVKALSLGGYDNLKLALAFGSRGAGKALAHYEPSRVVINLTKMKGAGSLAHEMAHALDDYLGNYFGLSGMATVNRLRISNPRIKECISNLATAMHYRTLSKQETYDYLAKNFPIEKATFISSITSVDRSCELGFIKWGDEADKQKYEECSKTLKEDLVGLDEWLAVLSKAGKHVVASINKDYLTYKFNSLNRVKETLDTYIKTGEIECMRGRTKFYLDALSFDSKSKAYWSMDFELFARSFAGYVEDNLGYKSQYLVYGTHHVLSDGRSVNPLGEERKAIHKAIEDLIEAIRSEILGNKGFDFVIPPQGTGATRVDSEKPKDKDQVVVTKKEPKPKKMPKGKTITSAVELRDYLKGSVIYKTKHPTNIKKCVNGLVNQGVEVNLDSIPTAKKMGKSKTWYLEDDSVVIDKKAPIEKQLEGLLECVTTHILEQLPTPNGLDKEYIRQMAVYKLCKSFGLDVRTYCQGKEFDAMIASGSVEAYVELALQLVVKVKAFLGLK
jgi:hypothetical protein